MPKNLLLIHLESVSQMAFWQYSAEMPTLFELMRNSAAFSRFYSASTSSVMSMSDLLHGDSAEMDHLAVFPKNKGSLAGASSNLIQILIDNGYAVHGVQYGSFCLGDAPNNFWGVWPEAGGQFRQQSDREEMHREIRNFLGKSKSAGQPFVLYFWNMNTHLRDDDPLEPPDQAYHERFRSGYRLLDLSVKRLFGDLGDLDLFDDTLVVAFGDHGDDLFRHGLYRGRSHIIDPYANVCWCPLFIHDKSVEICISQQLVSMVDIKPTLLHMLLPGRQPEPLSTAFSGMNILASERTAAFTQSMFALQVERSDPARAITKSYAVTDGDFRLMVSSPVNLDDQGGVEFFFEQWDYGNTRNLLDFCRLDPQGKITGFGHPDAVHPHFVLTFTRKHVDIMAKTYEKLRQLLYSFIKLKEEQALKRFKDERKELFPDELFTRKRVRKAW